MKKNKFVLGALTLAMSLSLTMPSFAFFRQASSIKGISTSDVNMLQDVTELGCQQVVLCVHASFLKDSQQMRSLKALINQMNQRKLTITMIVLNDYQAGDSIIPAGSEGSGAAYYQFNTLDEAGIKRTMEVANAYAREFKDTVSNWVIGNEINNRQVYNYMPGTDINSYNKAYADAFRIFYNAIKAQNPEARVFIPFDYNWTQGNGLIYPTLNMLPTLNNYLADTDYGIAWHPYPQDLANADFLNSSPLAVDRPNSPIVNMKNLHVLTDYLQQQNMLSPTGQVRHVILSEEGFSSARGEDVQAVAIQQAYELAKANPYVEGFLMSRLVDAPVEVAQNYSFGLWYSDGNEANPTTKKMAWYTYQQLN